MFKPNRFLVPASFVALMISTPASAQPPPASAKATASASAAPAPAEAPPAPPSATAGAGRPAEQHDGAAEASGSAVILPGQEDLVAGMVGKGAALPGECKWAGASIERVVVVSKYTCAGGEVALELRHPSQGAGAAARTQSFAVFTKSGSPPPGLVDAVASSVRAGEATFRWSKAPGPPPGERRGEAPAPAAKPSVGRPIAAVVAALVLGLLGIRYLRGRRKQASAKAPPESPPAPKDPSDPKEP